MQILSELVYPLSLSDFLEKHYDREPFAAPITAKAFQNLISWPLLKEITLADHPNCWLVKQGLLHKNAAFNTGRLQIEDVQKEFSEGYTFLVRHSEQAHPVLGVLANQFERFFQKPIDIQLYCTPHSQEGFDWHYDLENVFVIQSSGEKEFRLKPNSINPRPIKMPKDLEFEKETNKMEIRCWLKAGDWLYIPRGYWHKARAITDSFHLSIGVL